MNLPPGGRHGSLTLLDRAHHVELLVVGDLVLDAWLAGRTERLCREGPVPVLDVHEETHAAGGAGNAAANAAALGVGVRMVGVVGDDPEGAAVLGALSAKGVDVSTVLRVPSRRTPAKRRLVSEGQLLARFDTAAADSLPEHAERRVVEGLSSQLAEVDAVLVSDYGLGTLGTAARRRLRHRDGDAPFVVDSHDIASWAPVVPEAVTPNWSEAIRLLGRTPHGESRAEMVEASADQLFEASGAALVAVTLDEDGAVLLEEGRPHHRAYARRVASRPGIGNTGTGDCFAAAFAVAVATGADATAALEFAVATSGVVAMMPGTGICDLATLRAELAGAAGVVVDEAELAELVGGYREAGRRIVFTNGCFDVLHRGHVSYLNEARRLGDVLVVGLNDDMGVHRLKGAGRPVNCAADRAAVLAALSCVDHVTIFSEDSPRGLLRAVRPEIYVKGGDYSADTVPEAELVRALGGELRILGYLADHSTSGIVSRIRGGAEAESGA